jgi:hypothetical protein
VSVDRAVARLSDCQPLSLAPSRVGTARADASVTPRPDADAFRASAGGPSDAARFTDGADGGLHALLREALQTEEAATALLSSLQAHVSALALVAEAERCGAVTLPAGVAHAVAVARRVLPPFLRGTDAPVQDQAVLGSLRPTVLWAPPTPAWGSAAG